MKIYDMLIYDEVDIYIRDRVTHNSNAIAQQKLAKWFVTPALTEEIFIELLTMKTIKLQDRSTPTEFAIDEFKSFMANYFLDNPNLTQKSFNMVIKYLIKTDNFRHNTDNILQSKLCTEEIFNIALDDEFLGTDRNTIHHLFTNMKMSEKTLLKFTDLGYNSRQWSAMIKNQDLTPKIIDIVIKETDNKPETIFSLAEYNHEVDTTLFLDMLRTYDPDDTWENPAKAIKKMILKDRNLFEDVFLWKPIYDFINNKASTQDKAIIFHAILTFPNVSTELIDNMCDWDSAMVYIIDNMNIDKIHETNRMEIYNFNHYDAFLPKDAQEMFLF